ncbi:MAG TPA: PIN domain-containing protein [Blastocatellia bacterium]|nr:PIN domain-containing protein [Blastocatellia bacterium]
MPDPIVLCDANIFYSILMTDMILSLGEAGLYRPRWTNDIHEEWIRSVLKNQAQRAPEQLERRRAFMDQAIGYDLIENYERHIEGLVLPDPDDRHVLAAAIEAGAEILLTYNLRDFPEPVVAPHGVTVTHPDEFLCRYLLGEAETVLSVVEEMRVKRKRPEISQPQLLEKLARLSIPRFVEMLRKAGSGDQG